MKDAQLDGLIDIFKKSIHPEITHFRKGLHPGKGWYLKTVCPSCDLEQIDKLGYGEIWNALSIEYTTKIKILSEAYDWDGMQIPYMNSVWINENDDIIFNYNKSDGQVEITFIERHEGLQVQIMKLKYIIETERNIYVNNISKNNSIKYEKELIDIENIVNNIQKGLLTSDIEKYNIPKKIFRIITGGKKIDNYDN